MAERDLLLQLFMYNAWANEHYRQVLASVPLEKLKIQTEYGLLLDRIIHIFASYEMWFARIHGKSPQSQMNSSNFTSWGEIESKWKESDQLFIDYLKSVENSKLLEKASYTSLDGKNYTRVVRDILLHLIQHPTYHRGQISAILKERGIAKMPGTDMVVFVKPETH